MCFCRITKFSWARGQSKWPLVYNFTYSIGDYDIDSEYIPLLYVYILLKLGRG